jgi:hypothetical protein
MAEAGEREQSYRNPWRVSSKWRVDTLYGEVCARENVGRRKVMGCRVSARHSIKQQTIIMDSL